MQAYTFHDTQFMVTRWNITHKQEFIMFTLFSHEVVVSLVIWNGLFIIFPSILPNNTN
jgi:hypothetical protein